MKPSAEACVMIAPLINASPLRPDWRGALTYAAPDMCDISYAFVAVERLAALAWLGWPCDFEKKNSTLTRIWKQVLEV